MRAQTRFLLPVVFDSADGVKIEFTYQNPKKRSIRFLTEPSWFCTLENHPYETKSCREPTPDLIFR